MEKVLRRPCARCTQFIRIEPKIREGRVSCHEKITKVSRSVRGRLWVESLCLSLPLSFLMQGLAHPDPGAGTAFVPGKAVQTKLRLEIRGLFRSMHQSNGAERTAACVLL